MRISLGVSKTKWTATVSSTTPSPEPRCPPDCDTAEIISARSSSASCGSCTLSSARMSPGNWMVSKRGVSGRLDIAPALTRSNCSGTVPALAPDFDHGAAGGETGVGGSLADAAGDVVVVDVRRLPAIVADQEDAVVQAAGMFVGDIGVGAFDPHRQVGRDEQIEDPVHAVGRYAAALLLRHFLGDVIGRCRLGETGKRVEHRLAHVGPLLAALGQAGFRSGAKRLALGGVVIVAPRKGKVGMGARAKGKIGAYGPLNKRQELLGGDQVQPVAEREDADADHRVECFGPVMRQGKRAGHDSEAKAADRAGHGVA